MPTTTDLIDLLHERSEHPTAAPALDDLHRRIGRRRTTRRIGVAAATLALAAVAAAPIALTGAGGPDAADPTIGSVTGLRLVDAKVIDVPAERSATYPFTPTSYDFEFGMLCQAGPSGRVEAAVDGRVVAAADCSIMAPLQAFDEVVHIDPPAAQRHPWKAYGVALNRPLTVTLTATGDLTAGGRATLLVYGPAPLGARPGPVRVPPGTTLINSVDALASGANEFRPMLLSVRKTPGRHIGVVVEGYGAGEVDVYANRQKVQSMTFPPGELSTVAVGIDPARVAADVPDGEWFTIGVDTRGFAAPLWRITVLDTPPGKPTG